MTKQEKERDIWMDEKELGGQMRKRSMDKRESWMDGWRKRERERDKERQKTGE